MVCLAGFGPGVKSHEALFRRVEHSAPQREFLAHATALGTLVWGLREGDSLSPLGNFHMKRALHPVGTWFSGLLP